MTEGPKFKLTNPLSNLSTSSEDSVEGLSAVDRENVILSESEDEVEIPPSTVTTTLTKTPKVRSIDVKVGQEPPSGPPGPSIDPAPLVRHSYLIEKKRGPKLSISIQLPPGMPPKRKRGRPRKNKLTPEELEALRIRSEHEQQRLKNLEIKANEQSHKESENLKQIEVEVSTEEVEEEEIVEPPQSLQRSDGSVVDWDLFLDKAENLQFIPPVTYFKHAPLHRVWDKFAEPNRVIEMRNIFVDFEYPTYWLGTLKGTKGYKMLVEYERFGMKPPQFAWISFCSGVPKHVGWADQNNALISPGPDIRSVHPDWHEKAKEFLKGKSTILENHLEHLEKLLEAELQLQVNGIKVCKVDLGSMVEILDNDKIGVNKIGRVIGICGDRVCVLGLDEIDGNGTWHSVHSSDRIHPQGWSHAVGHPLLEPEEPLKAPPLPKGIWLQKSLYETPEFILVEGMYLEVRHPLHPYRIAPASIKKILNHGYIMVQIETAVDYRNKVRTCFHLTSPYIFRCGFSATQGIAIEAPKDVFNTFYWPSYLTMNGLEPAPLEKLNKKRAENKFKIGMKMEAVMKSKTSYIGPATVEKVAEHLLLISFDGWPKQPKYSQWMDFEDPDIYPIGWCVMVGHKFSSRVEAIPEKHGRMINEINRYFNSEIDLKMTQLVEQSAHLAIKDTINIEN